MNDKRNPLRQPLSSFPKLSREDLEERYAEVQAARDADWHRWREREKELLTAVYIPHNEKPAKRTLWEQFLEKCGMLQNALMPLFLVIYAWWDSTKYPYPGKGFWTGEATQTVFQWSLVAILAVAMLRPVLFWILLSLIGCLLFSFLFSGGR